MSAQPEAAQAIPFAAGPKPAAGGDSRSLWAITSYFNPQGFERRRQAYRQFRRALTVPLVTVELGYDGRFDLGPDNADVFLAVPGSDLLWQKERMLNLALQLLPPECDVVAWLDCDILFVNDTYLNLDKRTVQGLDLGLYYDLDDTPVGNFSFRVNAALLDKFFQGVSPNGEIINAAVAAGDISTLLGANGQGDLIRDFGRPEWRYSASLSWDYDAWGAAWFTSYVGDVYDDFNTLNGQPWIIDEYQTHNLYVQYEFDHDTDAPMRVRVGARNLFDETPPLADTNFGFLGELHNPQGRFVYVNVRKTF